MNKEGKNSLRKEMLGKLEEQWTKSHSPEDDRKRPKTDLVI